MYVHRYKAAGKAYFDQEYLRLFGGQGQRAFFREPTNRATVMADFHSAHGHRMVIPKGVGTIIVGTAMLISLSIMFRSILPNQGRVAKRS